MLITLFIGQNMDHLHHLTSVSGQADYLEEKENNQIDEVIEWKVTQYDRPSPRYRHRRSVQANEHLFEHREVRKAYNESSPCSISTKDSEVTVDCSRLLLDNLSPSCIESRAFEGLYQLQILDLYNNEIDFANDSIPESIFSPLTNLRKLNVVQNTNLSSHGKEIFRPLVSLESLSLNVMGDYMQFGPEFKNLTKLSYLTATGNVQYINDSTFKNLASLKELFLDDMVNLINMSKDSFSPLVNLCALRMGHVQVDFHHALSLLHVFQGRNMSLISFDTVSWSFSKQDIKTYGYLTSSDTQYLTNICVQRLILSDTNLFVIEPSAFNKLTLWDKCLENFQISTNTIVGHFTAFIKIFRLKNLRTIVLSDSERRCYGHFVTGISLASNTIDVNAVRFIVSQSLSGNLRLTGAENVQYIDLSDNGFVEFYGVIEGLPYLKTVLLGGNDVSQLAETFFDTFPALEDLNLANCRLDPVLMATNSVRVFNKLVFLKSLDLSENALYLLSPGTFSVNKTNLQRLILSQNQFKEIPFHLSDTPNLTELDLTHNALTWLDKPTIEALDHLASGKNGFTLRLYGNVLSCGCQNLQFLQWMLQTKVRLDNDGNFTCINGDGLLVSTGSFHDLDALWRECVGQMFLAVALILLCIYVIGFLSVFLFLKHKTLIRSTVLQLLGGFKLHTKDDYDIGVYIGYADADYRFPCTYLREYIEDKLQMSTYISHRDLLPSSYKASAIVDAINSSWRILLVCSRGFLQDDQWSMFAMRSAVYSQSPANPDRVLVLVHEQCVHQLPTDLLGALSEDRIIVVDKWEMDYKLREKLRTRLNGL
ncbi:hypothetical protein Btru_028071 [Bulinus truncatus]|nr:hypothetical protein Btru_028071 [Bulinus truncatus]